MPATFMIAAMWPFKHYITGPVVLVIKARVSFPKKTARSKEACLTSFPAVVIYLLKRFTTGDTIATIDVNLHNFKQSSLTATDYAQKPWRKTSRYCSVYTVNILNG